MPGAYGRPAVVLSGCLLVLTAGAAWGGTLRLRVSPVDGINSVQALDRESGQACDLAKTSTDEGTAVYERADLPPGTYDLVLLTPRGRIEGVNLHTTNGVDTEGAGSATALSEADVKEITRLVTGMTSFADRRRILALEGAGTEARVLVEELTTRQTTLPSAQPFVVWRVEVWSYRKEFGAWDRYRWKVMARERPSVSDYEGMTWVFEPKLGGVVVSDETPLTEVTYRVPADLDPGKGLVAGKNSLK
jgi:hypothetical protein